MPLLSSPRTPTGAVTLHPVFSFLMNGGPIFGKSKLMIVKEPSLHLSIGERMCNVHERMRLERISGISAANREEFLAFCCEQEALGSAVNAQAGYTEEGFDKNAVYWSVFNDWNNSPAFSLNRRKVEVG